MYLFIIAGLALVISFVLALFFEDFAEIGILISVIALLVLTVSFFVLWINHETASGKIAQYEIIKETIEVSRKNEISDIERATLTQKIIEVNQDIAGYKHWNETSWDIYIPDELTELEYLK